MTEAWQIFLGVVFVMILKSALSIKLKVSVWFKILNIMVWIIFLVEHIHQEVLGLELRTQVETKGPECPICFAKLWILVYTEVDLHSAKVQLSIMTLSCCLVFRRDPFDILYSHNIY